VIAVEAVNREADYATRFDHQLQLAECERDRADHGAGRGREDRAVYIISPVIA